MALTALIGRPNTGKTRDVIARLRLGMSDNHMAGAVVLPSQPDVQAMRRDLAAEFPLGLWVGTFDDLVASLWERFGDGRTILAPGARGALLSALARERGLSGRMVRLADRCVQVASTETGESWRAPVMPAPAAGERLAELLVSYARVLSDRALVEPSEAAHQLARQSVCPAPTVVWHRFTDLTPAQLALVRSMASVSDVTVSLTYSEDMPQTRAMEPLLKALHPDALKQTDRASLETSQDLIAFSDAVFAGGGPLGVSGNIRFGRAEGSHAQAVLVVDEVIRALKDGAADSPERIAVVVRRVEDHEEALGRAFREAGMSCDFDTMRLVGATPLGAVYLAALQFAQSGERSAFLQLVRSHYSGIGHLRARQIEADVRGRGLAEPGALLAQLRAATPELTQLLQRIRSWGKPEFVAPEALAALVDHLYANGRRGGAQDAASIESDSRVQRAVCKVLDQIAALEIGMEVRDFIDTLRKMGVGASAIENSGHVQVMSVERVRGRRFDTVIIAGLERGEFPSAGDDEFVAGGAVAEVLAAFGTRVQPWRGGEYEEYLFHDAVTRARERIVFVTRTADDSGAAVSPSRFFEAAADAVLGPGEDRAMPEHTFVSLTGQHELHLEGDGRRSKRARRRQPASTVDPARRRAATVRGVAPEVPPLPADHVFSPSEIETYLQCPYRWFMRYRVKGDDLEQEYGARDEGDMAHRFLKAIYEDLIGRGAARITETTLPEATGFLDKLRDSAEREARSPSFQQQVGLRNAYRWARRILEEDAQSVSGFVPEHVEWRFGREGDPVDMGGFLMSGSVDRIERNAAGDIAIVDYKRTVGLQYAASKMVSERKVQVPLYAHAVSQRLGAPVVAGIYRCLAESAMRGVITEGCGYQEMATRTDVRPREDVVAIIEESLDLARMAVAGMRLGEAHARPSDAQACAYCSVVQCGGRR